MKKIKLVGAIFIVGFFSCFISSCNNDIESTPELDVTGVSLNIEQHTFNAENETLQLIATVTPSNPTSGSVNWTSSDESVVIVNSTGVVTAVNTGSASVTVTTDDGGFQAVCQFTADFGEILIQIIELSTDTPLFTDIGAMGQVNAAITPSNASSIDLVWSSSDDSIATIDQNGGVTSTGDGVATITATATDGSGISESIEITVDTSSGSISVSEVKFKLLNATLETGQSLQLQPVIFPENATNKNITYSSSDDTAVSVTDDGIVNTFAAGHGIETMITVTTEDGSFTDVVLITVKNINAGPPTARGSFSDGDVVNVLIMPISDTKVSLDFMPASSTITAMDEELMGGVQTVKADDTFTDITSGTAFTGLISNNDGTSMEVRIHRGDISAGFNAKGVWNIDGTAFPDGNVTYTFTFINP